MKDKKTNQKTKKILGPIFDKKPKRSLQLDYFWTTSDISPVNPGPAVSPNHNRRYF